MSLGDRADAAARALLALDASGMASWRWDADTNMVTGDDRLAELYGFARGHWPIPLGAMTACIHPQDEAGVTQAITASLETGRDYETEFRVRRTRAAHPDDPAAWRWLRGRGRRTRTAPDAPPSGMLGVNWDVTEEKASEERLAVLAQEMDHRVKNAFAVMRALVNIGRRRATDLDSFASDLGAQVQAMADGHELAARMAQEAGDPHAAVPIADVVRIALAPWLAVQAEGGPAAQGGGGRAGEGGRLTLSMNPRLCVALDRVSSLSMLLHELMSNAVRHGALRPGAGRLRVTVEETRRSGREAARLVWAETVAAPLPAPTGETSGFGDILIEHCLSSLTATAERDLAPEGLKLTMVLPIIEEREGGGAGRRGR